MSARVDGVASRVQSAIQMRQVSESSWVNTVVYDTIFIVEKEIVCICIWLRLSLVHVGYKLHGGSCQVNGFSSKINELGKGTSRVVTMLLYSR